MDIQQINKAIGSHGLWKVRLRQAIESGACECTVDEIRRDDRCDFGKWIYSLPTPTRDAADWKKVRDLHAAFHNEAAGVLVLALADRKAEAEAALGAGSNYAQVSLLLTAAMMDWMNHIQDVE